MGGSDGRRGELRGPLAGRMRGGSPHARGGDPHPNLREGAYPREGPGPGHGGRMTEDLETPEILAGEYVLGTLRGEDRARFEAELARDPGLARLVEAWERRLASLAASLPSQQPPPRVWRRISARLDRAPAPGSATRGLRAWRALALAASLALVVTGALLVARERHGTPLTVALLADEKAKPVLLVSAQDGGAPLRVRLLRQPETPKDRTLELWLLPHGDGPPRSIGLISSEGPTELRLTPEQVRAFEDAKGLAVSVEPPGGSPTGAPTGPVVFSGEIQTSL